MRAVAERLFIFDTTLRDGEQAPGSSMQAAEKFRLAQALARLRVDVIEAGFAVASPEDFAAIREIAGRIKGPTIAALARADLKDIDTAWQALKGCAKPRLHTFIATSPIHLKHKLRLKPGQVLKHVERAVAHAASFKAEVEFSAEDATRSERKFLRDIFSAAIAAGATIINVADTVGYTVPGEFADLIRFLREGVEGIDRVTLSVHCHDDLGLAVANSLAALQAGARQIECTLNGIGERAGNASLEEIVMAVRTRPTIYPFKMQIKTPEIHRTSRLVSHLTGLAVPANKAVVGANAFAHEAGIHQDGLLKHPETYQIIKPQSVGASRPQLVLGKHSGRHALAQRLKKLGFALKAPEIAQIFLRFKDLADKKKKIFDEDLEMLVTEEILRVPARYKLIFLEISSGNVTVPSATVQLEIDGVAQKSAAFGDGPVDATYKAIKSITGDHAQLVDYQLRATTSGTDAQGEVLVTLQENGRRVRGQGSSTDISVASALAYLNALNRLTLRTSQRRLPRN